MFNAKWGIICGGAAFVLAFIISLLLGHTNPLVALARAGGFAALFFCLGTGVWALINIFIPELLNVENDDASDVFSKKATGARVNITLDDNSDPSMAAALPDPATEAADLDEVDDFKDLVSRSVNRKRDIDQNSATGYTEKEEREEFVPAFDTSLDSSFDSSPGSLLESPLDSVKVDGLGDFSMDFGAFVPEGGKASELDSFMDPFSFMPGSGDSMSKEEALPPSAQPRSSSNKTAQLQGDFDPKEIAAGIRTVLEKDKKG